MRGRKRWLLLLFLPLAAGIFLLCRKPEIPGGTEAERRAFLERFGWELQEECRRKDLTIPMKFDIVYENYNRIQRDQGFDLRKYAGKEVQRFQYVVTNYPNYPEGIRANLLVFNGKIIGGDLCSFEFGGFMHGFENLEGENAKK